MSENSRIGGFHSVQAALDCTPERIVRVWLDQQRRDRRLAQIKQRFSDQGIPLESVSRKNLDKMLPDAKHQGLVIEIRLPVELDENELFKAIATQQQDPFYLALDQVQDPHNLGACLRSADAAGVQGIVLPKKNATGITPTVCKVASGAVESVPLYRVTNLSRTMKRLKQAGLWIVGADGDAEQIAFETDLSGPVLLVLGAEGRGLRRLTRENCDRTVRLPMMGTVASLNVSVATGVLMYEVVRQRTALSARD